MKHRMRVPLTISNEFLSRFACCSYNQIVVLIINQDFFSSLFFFLSIKFAYEAQNKNSSTWLQWNPQFNLHAIFPFYVLILFPVSFQFVYFQQNHHHENKLVLTSHKHHQLFRSWHNTITKFNHYSIRNSFENIVIQSTCTLSTLFRFKYSKINK